MSTLTQPGISPAVDPARVRPAVPTLISEPIVFPRWRTRLLWGMTGLSALLMAISFGLALFYADMDVATGNVQRIFYMHVGAFSGAATAFFVTVAAGLIYLITRNLRWDKLALAGVKIGLPLSMITLITGAIWARPTWNTWWTRDPRLDAMLVMAVIYAAYLTLRSAIGAAESKARFAAVYGILAFVSVIYTTLIIRVRPDTLHPVVIGVAVDTTNAVTKAQGSFALTSSMIFALSVASVSWMILAITLMWHSVRLETLAQKVNALKMRALAED